MNDTVSLNLLCLICMHNNNLQQTTITVLVHVHMETVDVHMETVDVPGMNNIKLAMYIDMHI